MRLNTEKSIALARRVKAEYGTWKAVREASTLIDGVYVLPSRKPVIDPMKDGEGEEHF